MAMSIKDVLAAQQRAANACKKPKPAPYKKAVPVHSGGIRDILEAQRRTCAHNTPAPAPVKPAAPKSTVAEIIARQRATAASQKVTGGINPSLTRAQTADVANIKARYESFLVKIEKQLAEEDAKRIKEAPVPEVVDAVVAVPPFTPNVPEEMEIVVDVPAPESDVNGISVGEEMGGQVTVSTRARRRNRKRKAAAEGEQVG